MSIYNSSSTEKKRKRKILKKWRVRILTLWSQWVCQFSRLSRKLSFQSFTLLQFFFHTKVVIGEITVCFEHWSWHSRALWLFFLISILAGNVFMQSVLICYFQNKIPSQVFIKFDLFCKFHQCLIESKSKDLSSLLTFTLSNSKKMKTLSIKKTRWGPLRMMCSVMIQTV